MKPTGSFNGRRSKNKSHDCGNFADHEEDIPSFPSCFICLVGNSGKSRTKLRVYWAVFRHGSKQATQPAAGTQVPSAIARFWRDLRASHRSG